MASKNYGHSLRLFKLRAQLNIMMRSNAFSPQNDDNGDEYLMA